MPPIAAISLALTATAFRPRKVAASSPTKVRAFNERIHCKKHELTIRHRNRSRVIPNPKRNARERWNPILKLAEKSVFPKSGELHKTATEC